MMRRSPFLSGMSMIEVMATVVILSILTVLAVPAFRALQGRQSLVLTQKGLQSVLYRLHQLALAPEQGSTGDFEVVGYGLAVYRKSSGSSIPIGGCQVKAETDVIALLKIVKFDSGTISNYLVDGATPLPASPSSPTCQANPIEPKDFPNTFFVMPSQVRLAETTSPPLPWLIVEPLVAIGASYGQLCQSAGSCLTSNVTNPLVSPGTGRLRIAFTGIKASSSGQKRLCREVVFSRDVTIQAVGKVVAGGCHVSS